MPAVSLSAWADAAAGYREEGNYGGMTSHYRPNVGSGLGSCREALSLGVRFTSVGT